MECQESVDQQQHPALAILTARPDIFTRQGTVVATWRRHGTKTYGPYYRLAYRDAGRQTSIYLGREDKPENLVERVRQKLDALQTPLRHRRALDRLRRHVSAALRVQKTKLNALLLPFGLRLKGFEVRGWRTSPLRPVPTFAGVAAQPRSTTMRLSPGSLRLPRARQLRLYPKGNAASMLRKKKQCIPASPKQRIEALIAARRNR